MSDKTFRKLKGVGNRFVKLKCPDCSNTQVTYTKISSVVQCNVCGATIARPTGGTMETLSEEVEEVK
jgi:small subunit ribosomal protein S27e